MMVWELGAGILFSVSEVKTWQRTYWGRHSSFFVLMTPAWRGLVVWSRDAIRPRITIRCTSAGEIIQMHFLMLSTRTDKHWARKLLLQINGLEGAVIMYLYNLRQFPHSFPVATFNYMYTLQSPTGAPYKNLLTQLCHIIKLKNNTPSSCSC